MKKKILLTLVVVGAVLSAYTLFFSPSDIDRQPRQLKTQEKTAPANEVGTIEKKSSLKPNVAHVMSAERQLPANLSSQFNAASLPSPDLPLVKSFTDLKNSAENGNYLAACRLGVELGQCKLLDAMASRVKNLKILLDEKQANSEDTTAIKSDMDYFEQQVEKGKALCGDFNSAGKPEPWRYLYQAALLGHVPSKVEFTLSPPVDPSEMFQNSEFFEAYKGSAGSFLVDAANAGSVNAAYRLSWAYLGASANSVQKPGFGIELVKQDPQKAAIYLYAAIAFPHKDAAELRAYESLKAKVESQLTLEQVAIAKSSANELLATWRAKPQKLFSAEDERKKTDSTSRNLCEY